MVYRAFVMESATWVPPPLSERSDLPEWFVALSLWVNTNWDLVDKFNGTWGDPNVTLAVVSAIKVRALLSWIACG